MSKDSAGRKVNVTRDYRLFNRSDDNRVIAVRKHKQLFNSMKEYGFLPCFPIVCIRDARGNLIIKDGQHRHAIAETLGLPVYFIEETIDFDIAKVNSTSRVWAIKDYAEKYAASGIKPYVDGLEFCDRYKIPVGTAFAILAGTTGFSNIEEPYKNGSFKIKDLVWAEKVASTYSQMIGVSHQIKHANFLAACMSVCRVEYFDTKRLIQCAERCREKLVSYSTREAYLAMLDDVYNFGRQKLAALKHDATLAMKERNATVKARATKAAKHEKATLVSA